MDAFEYTASPVRVLFGLSSSNKVGDEVKRLNASAPLLLSTPRGIEHTNKLAEVLSRASIQSVGAFNDAVMHTPVAVTQQALQILKAKSADCIISIGGGSVVGLGKALSKRTLLSHICIPTTYAGSEMTPILGETNAGKKTTHSDPKLLPAVVLYDVGLTMTLPSTICTTSGINAIAHAVEALYARNTNPIVSLLAIEGIKALAGALPQIVQHPSSTAPREQALYGAWLCGTCLGSSGMALHHKICHVLGGSFNLAHAEVHTIILPHALSYNTPAISVQLERLAAAFPDSNGDAVRGLNVLLNKTKAPRALKDIGMKEDDIETAVGLILSAQCVNPRALEETGIRRLLQRAWAGEPAKADL